MADPLVPDDFLALDAPLQVEVEPGRTVGLTVESVEGLPGHRLRAEPFSMVLLGPRVPALPQATYALQHPRLGPIEVFLVPIGLDARGARYEATFN